MKPVLDLDLELRLWTDAVTCLTFTVVLTSEHQMVLLCLWTDKDGGMEVEDGDHQLRCVWWNARRLAPQPRAAKVPLCVGVDGDEMRTWFCVGWTGTSS